MTQERKVNILLVDDSQAKLLSLETILQPLKEHVLRAENADEALRLLLSHDVAVLLIDVCMPGMNGFELAEMIRSHPRYRRTAIIFISAVHLTDEDRIKGYELGAVDYIPVPIIPAVLRAKVSVFVELFRKREELQALNRELEQRVLERTSDLAMSAERLRDSEVRFQQIAHAVDDAFWLAAAEPAQRLLYVSPAWETIWGRSIAGAADPLQSWGETIVAEDRAGASAAIQRALKPEGEGLWEREYRIARPNGEVRWVHERGRVLRGAEGAVNCVGCAQDVTDVKLAQEVLARDREALEQLVNDRTAELEASTMRLRMADRMATIGTLSAGLGHDMGNLLLPVRARLDTIEAHPLSDAVRTEVAAIRKATEYLQRLARNLRLLSLDPESEGEDGGNTNLAEWWTEVEGMMRNGVHRSIAIKSEIPQPSPRVQIGRAGLTQVVFNLVQNAGDALAGVAGGTITVSAQSLADGRVCVSVADNGPGMSEDVRRRCVEPFFTTKTRGLSTGLGLALVSGIAKTARATMEIETELGRGTTFKILLQAASPHASNGKQRKRGVASVKLSDQRMTAHVRAVLSSLEFDVHNGEAAKLGNPVDVDLLVTEADAEGGFQPVLEFVAARPSSRALVFGGRSRGAAGDRIVCLELASKPSVVRSHIYGMLNR